MLLIFDQLDYPRSNLYPVLSEEAAADEKRGKLYKPKSRFETQTKSILPLETPPQFLALDKRNVSTCTCLVTAVVNEFFFFFTVSTLFHFWFRLWRKAVKRKRRRATWSFSKKNLNSKFRRTEEEWVEFEMWNYLNTSELLYASFSTGYRRKGMKGTDWKVVLVVLNLSRVQKEDAHVSVLSCVAVFPPHALYPFPSWNKIYTAFLLLLADGSSRRNRPFSGNFNLIQWQWISSSC